MVQTFFFYQNSQIHSALVIIQSHLQSRGCELWFSPLAEFLLFLFSVCLFYLVSPYVSHRALKSASIFSRNCALFYAHPHPNAYTRNVRGVFEIKPCVSLGLKYLLTWRHVLNFFPLLVPVITLLILLVLHLKIWVLDFSEGCWVWFPFLAERRAQSEAPERGQKSVGLLTSKTRGPLRHPEASSCKQRNSKSSVAFENKFQAYQ